MFFLLLLLLSCKGPYSNNNLDLLPIDIGGTHLALTADSATSTIRPYGTYLYLPYDYQSSPIGYPLLIFLHGAGERGNSETIPSELDRVLSNGPPKLISNGTWNPPYPMIVMSPQQSGGWWNVNSIDKMISWVSSNYPVDLTRIYITGLSLGGHGTWTYAGSSSRSYKPAAIVPISGGCAGYTPETIANNITDIATWTFHGSADTSVTPSNSIDIVKAINQQDPLENAKMTIYDGVGHSAWVPTYEIDSSNSGLNKGLLIWMDDSYIEPWLVKYNEDIYSWMLKHVAQ